MAMASHPFFYSSIFVLILPILLLFVLILPNMTKFVYDDSDSDSDSDDGGYNSTPTEIVHGKHRVFRAKLAPQSVFKWYEISIDKSTARRNSAIKEEALGHLVAEGWDVYYIQKKVKQELRYKSPKGRVYISLRTACKAYIDQYNAVRTTPPVAVPHQSEPPVVGKRKDPPTSLKKPKECVKARGNRNVRTDLFHLIERGIVSPGVKAYYLMGAAEEDPLTAWGTITNEGLIKCNCCSVAFSISKFEVHTGSTKHRPAANIFLQDGRSLLDCQKQLTLSTNIQNQNHDHDHQKVNNAHNSDTLSLDKSDCICSICHFGGELILCDSCPAVFHSSCLGFNGIPLGDWYCPFCICKICGEFSYTFDGVSLNHEFVKCVQCEQRVHIGCVKNIQILENNSHQFIDKENLFCTKICEDIHMGLQDILWKQIPLQQQQQDHHHHDKHLTWTLMKYTNTIAKHQKKKLNIAQGVMHESFRRVKDPITKNDIIHDVIFSKRSEVKRLNFEGFYTVVLQTNNIVSTVATVRVYGDEVAEVPFIATRSKHRRRGLCRTMMNELEKQLTKLGVKRLTLPAVDGALNTWTRAFGFSKMTDSDKLEFVKYTFLGFQDTVRCVKNLEKKIINTNDNMEWEPRKKLKQTDDFFSYLCLDIKLRENDNLTYKSDNILKMCTYLPVSTQGF